MAELNPVKNEGRLRPGDTVRIVRDCGTSRAVAGDVGYVVDVWPRSGFRIAEVLILRTGGQWWFPDDAVEKVDA